MQRIDPYDFLCHQHPALRRILHPLQQFTSHGLTQLLQEKQALHQSRFGLDQYIPSKHRCGDIRAALCLNLRKGFDTALTYAAVQAMRPHNSQECYELVRELDRSNFVEFLNEYGEKHNATA